MQEQKRRTWAEVSLVNIRTNYEALRELLPPGCKFMGMVKSDGYGHGALAVSRKLQELGADYLGVACIDEAIELRDGGDHPSHSHSGWYGPRGTTLAPSVPAGTDRL